MGIFDFFVNKERSASTKEEKALPWLKLTRTEQLEEILQQSKETPVAIFKHSTTCGVSRMALRNFERDFEVEEGKIKLYYLDLHAFREVSDKIGYTFQVLHQSPQLIIVKDGEAVHHASHYGIQAMDLLQYTG